MSAVSDARAASVSPRPRVWVAEVDDSEESLQDALRQALRFVRPRLRGNCAVLADGCTMKPKLAPGMRADRALLRELVDQLGLRDEETTFTLVGRVGGLEPLARERPARVQVRASRAAKLYRYQLSVGPRAGSGAPERRHWDRVLGAWELFHADSVLAVARLRGLPGAGRFHGAMRLVGRSVPAPGAGEGTSTPSTLDARCQADALELADPDLVVIDARRVGWGGDEMTQETPWLGAIVVAEGALAADLVCAQLLGIRDEDLEAVQLAALRGYGPASRAELELGGEADLDRLALRARGLAPDAPEGLAAVVARFADEGGPELPIAVFGAEPPGPSEQALACWLLRHRDEPGARLRVNRWPALTAATRLPGEPPPGPVLLLGDGAITSFRARCDDWTTWLRLPRRFARTTALPLAVHRFLRSDGASGWAWEVPGDPPSAGQLDRAFYLASGRAIRAPLLWAALAPTLHVRRWLAAMWRARRNRKGVPVVHARKMHRMLDRPWRQRWSSPPQLERRDPLALLGEGPAA